MRLIAERSQYDPTSREILLRRIDGGWREIGDAGGEQRLMAAEDRRARARAHDRDARLTAGR
jgi:hypothetical protein